MRAVVLHGPGDMRLERLPPPEVGPGMVPVAVEVVGICGSDLHYYREGRIGRAQVVARPFVPGHEIAGRVMEDVPGTGLRAGTLVAVEPNHPCGRCRQCRTGRTNLCPEARFLGAPPVQGGLAETVVVAPDQLLPVPEDFGAERAALLEPLAVCMHAARMAAPQWYESAAVLGCGPIGLMLLQLLRLAGCHPLFAVDPVVGRSEAALLFGADLPALEPATVLDATGGEGVDLVVEATNSPDGLEHACRLARRGGRVVVVGIPDGGAYRLEAAIARGRELDIRFSRRSTVELAEALRLLRSGRIDLDPLVTHRIGLDYVPDTFARLARDPDGMLKVLVHVGKGA